MRNISLGILLAAMILVLSACGSIQAEQARQNAKGPAAPIVDNSEPIDESDLRDLYLAGGCFWGVEAYMSRINGVYSVTSGYANGEGENPTYKDVIQGDRGFAETVHVKYDPKQVTLKKLIADYFRVIDPTSVNKQGNDQGIQYRSGIYYTHDEDVAVIQQVLAQEQEKYTQPIVTEVLPLQNYYKAEEYHQKYLEKNPNGYCHIDLSILDDQEIEIDPLYSGPSDEELKQVE